MTKKLKLEDLGLPEVIHRKEYRSMSIVARWDELNSILKSEDENKAAQIQQILDSIRDLDYANLEYNVEAHKHNLSIFNAIEAMTLAMGASKRIYSTTDRSSGHSYKKPRNSASKGIVTKERLDELYAHFPAEIEKKLQAEEKERKRLEEELERKRLIDEAWRENNKKWLQLSARYNPNWDAEEIMEFILSQSKYLRLAYAMKRARGTYSLGNLVEDCLKEFEIETEMDSLIVFDVLMAVEEWYDHGDGRAFRNCNFNYDFLMDIAREYDEELVKDFQVAYNYVV